MSIRTVEIKNLGKVYRDMYIDYDEAIPFIAVSKGSIVGYETNCKEELGQQAVKNQHYEFIILCPDKLDEKEVAKVKDAVNKEHKLLGVAGLSICRVKNKRKWLYIKHSPRWSRNSVAHSYLMTLIRKEIDRISERHNGDDEDHLMMASKVVKIIKKNGLKVFGIKQHKDYDVGMVSLESCLEDGFGSKKNFRDHVDEPNEEDYDNLTDYYEAYDEWEDANYDIGYNARHGDLDKDICADNAYKKLAKIYHGEK